MCDFPKLPKTHPKMIFTWNGCVKSTIFGVLRDTGWSPFYIWASEVSFFAPENGHFQWFWGQKIGTSDGRVRKRIFLFVVNYPKNGWMDTCFKYISVLGEFFIFSNTLVYIVDALLGTVKGRFSIELGCTIVDIGGAICTESPKKCPRLMYMRILSPEVQFQLKLTHKWGILFALLPKKVFLSVKVLNPVFYDRKKNFHTLKIDSSHWCFQICWV